MEWYENEGGREQLAAVDPDILCADGYEAAIVGYIETFGPSVRALYDYETSISILMVRDGMTQEEAMEYFDYNTMGYGGLNEPPCFAEFNSFMDELEYRSILEGDFGEELQFLEGYDTALIGLAQFPGGDSRPIYDKLLFVEAIMDRMGIDLDEAFDLANELLNRDDTDGNPVFAVFFSVPDGSVQ